MFSDACSEDVVRSTGRSDREPYADAAARTSPSGSACRVRTLDYEHMFA